MRQIHIIFILMLMLATAGTARAKSIPPPAVGVAPVVVANIAPSSSDIGHVIAIQSVAIVPRVTAFIDEVNVQQGSTVRIGQILFSLQTKQFRAALQLAQANLVSAEAALENAELVYERAARLRTTGFEAQANLDQAQATRNEDQANVLAAQANVATAELNLSYCTIRAPIAGRIGAVTKTKGNLVTANSGVLATINQLNPIRVVFAVNSDSPILAATEQTGGTDPPTDPPTNSPGAPDLAVALQMPSGATYPYKGKIAFFDNRVDSQTGTVNVYADFPNPQSLLLPGAYVSVEVGPAKPEESILLPVAAVQTDQSGNFVLVVGPDNKVKQQSVTLGEQIGQNFIVKTGVAAGDRVIIDGAQKVKRGETVNPIAASGTQEAAARSANGKSN